MAELARLRLERLGQADLRNLMPGATDFAPRLNVIAGPNGHGKTSLIEAIYLLSTTRSFRTAQLGDVIQSGKERARLRGSFLKGDIGSIQEAELSWRGRSFRIDGKSPPRRLEYAQSKPVIAFHPGDLELSSGGAAERRRLLDRVLVYADPLGAEARGRYQEALKARQGLLASGGSDAELSVYEELAAEYGAALTVARARVAGRLLEAARSIFAEMAALGLDLRLDFVPGGTEDRSLFLAELRRRRVFDARRKAATFGPQKDDVVASLEGRSARSHASQGQQRLLALSFKLAELSLVRAATGVEPLLLLDDVSSELDAERTTAVFRFLRSTSSQVFVTTTRPELFQNFELSGDQRADFVLEKGQVRRLERPPL